jgi:2'-5' RNA ligase
MSSYKSEKRWFLAIDIPKDIKDQLYEAYKPYIGKDNGINFLGIENLHITLSFIEKLSDSEIDYLMSELKNEEFYDFPLQLVRN